MVDKKLAVIRLALRGGSNPFDSGFATIDDYSNIDSETLSAM